VLDLTCAVVSPAAPTKSIGQHLRLGSRCCPSKRFHAVTLATSQRPRAPAGRLDDLSGMGGRPAGPVADRRAECAHYGVSSATGPSHADRKSMEPVGRMVSHRTTLPFSIGVTLPWKGPKSRAVARTASRM